MSSPQQPALDPGGAANPQIVTHRGCPMLPGLLAAAEQRCNLLLNTGPPPDGSIHPEYIETLRAVGKLRRGA